MSQDAFRGIMLRGLDRLIPVGTEDVLGLEVATVTGTDPVTVHKLADPVGTDIQILTWWVPPTVGQRVWLLRTKTQRIIAGVHGGASSAPQDGTGADLDALVDGGTWYYDGATATGTPSAEDGFVEVLVFGSNRVQRASELTGAGITWTRSSSDSGSTWSPWTSPSSLPGGGISKASQTSSSAAWQVLDMDTESGNGISDLTGNRLILSPGVWSISGGFSTDTFSEVHATRAAITTSTSTPGSNILVEASLPLASGVHGYSLGVARVSLSVETSLYLRYLVDTSASHSILRAHLEAQRVQD